MEKSQVSREKPSSIARGAGAPVTALLREAFEYVFPLVEMGRLRLGDLGWQGEPVVQKLHAWRHSRKLFGNEDRWITTPNADTLYSSLWLDLSHGPVRLALPDFDGRYYSLAFIDMTTTNFAMIGRRATGTRASEFVVVGPN